MTLWGALAGGLVGTIALTSGLRIAQELGWTRMDIPLLLGTAFTDNRSRASVIGYAVHFANGLAVAGDGTLVFLESFKHPRLSEVRDSGLRVLADLAGTVPDGVALTAEGGYVVSCYYPFHIYYVPPEGGAAELLLDDATGTQFPMPTNVCFFGDGLATLAVASLGGYALSAVDIARAGIALHYPGTD